MTAKQIPSGEPEVVVDGVEGDGKEGDEVAELRTKVRVLAARLTEEIRKNEELYASRATDRGAFGIQHESLYGANRQLLLDRKALEDRVFDLEFYKRKAIEEATAETKALLVEEQEARAAWSARAIAAEREVEQLRRDLALARMRGKRGS